MPQFLGFSAVNPALLWGSLAIASPIIIHLLARRRFKIIDWAAMDFLLEAEKRNRRRIRLEHLILLLLRILAILLIALMLSRLFLTPRGLGAMLVGDARSEHIVLLDDSPSTQLTRGAENVFDRSKQAVIQLAESIATEKPEDTLTVILTSRPTQPLINGHVLEVSRGGEGGALGESSQRQIDLLKQLEPSDKAAEIDKALMAVADHLDETEGSGALNRSVYVVTDMREHDWPSMDRGRQGAVARALTQVNERADAISVVDLGDEPEPNLGIVDLQPHEQLLVAGVQSQFNVTVHNYGPGEARDVRVMFTAGDAVQQEKSIEVIPAHADRTVAFTFTFRESAEGADDPIELEEALLGVDGGQPVEARWSQTFAANVTAEIEADALPADNRRVYGANVRRGVGVLIVDGDPAGIGGLAESHFLSRVLDPSREVDLTGYRMTRLEEVLPAEFNLDPYQVVILANVYQVDEEAAEKLRQWVADGGGLLMFMGDQVDPAIYNEQLGETGLLPGTVVELRGDQMQRDWVLPASQAANHPVTRLFAGAGEAVLSGVKVFQWWGLEVDGEADEGETPLLGAAVDEDDAAQGAADGEGEFAADPASRIRVLARLTDPAGSPFIIEKGIGDGRVLVVTTSADDDFTLWPSHPSYAITLIEAVRHLARESGGQTQLRVGDALVWPIDLNRFQASAMIQPPGAGQTVTVQAAEPTADAAAAAECRAQDGADADAPATADDETDAAADGSQDPPRPAAARRAEASAERIIHYATTDTAGIYELKLTPQDTPDQTRTVVFAANIDPAEGDLTPADRGVLQRDLEETGAQFVDGGSYLERGDAGGRVELWRALAIALLVVLCAEQLLAWVFGRRR